MVVRGTAPGGAEKNTVGLEMTTVGKRKEVAHNLNQFGVGLRTRLEL